VGAGKSGAEALKSSIRPSSSTAWVWGDVRIFSEDGEFTSSTSARTRLSQKKGGEHYLKYGCLHHCSKAFVQLDRVQWV